MRKKFGLLGVVIVLTTAMLTLNLHPVQSLASWTDQEHVFATSSNNTIGTAQCEVSTTTSSALSKLLSGNLAFIDLDDIAEIHEVHVNNTYGNIVVDPVSSQNVLPPDGFAHPLELTALQVLNANLTGLLQFPLSTSSGAYNQFAQAKNLSESVAATGAVNNQGAIDLSIINNPAGPPTFATIELSQLMEAATGQPFSALVADVTNVVVDVGAVASYATLDGCAAMWSHEIYENLERQYMTSSLDASIVSPLVSDLGGTVTATLDGLENTLAQDLTLSLESATGPLVGLLSDILNGLPGIKIGVPSVSDLTLQVDLSAVMKLLTEPLVLGNNLGEIDVLSGAVTVDLTQLLGPSYTDSVGLNGLAPNTQLLIHEDALNHLLDEVLAVLTVWQTDVLDAITDAYSLVKIKADITVPIKLSLGLSLADVDINISVNSVDNPSNPVQVTMNCFTVCLLVNPLLSGLLGTIASGVLPMILGSVSTIVSGTVSTLSTTLTSLIGSNTVTGTVLGMLNTTLSALFDENAVISLIVNAQNAPDPTEISAPAGSEPGWASTLESPVRDSANAYSTGQWAVSALRFVTLGAVAEGIGLDLAKSLVGFNTS